MSPHINTAFSIPSIVKHRSHVCVSRVETLHVSLRSLLLNIPKFLEARLDTVSLGPDEASNTTRLEVIYNVTSLRLNPDYMYYYIHWTRSTYPISVSIRINMSDILLSFNVSPE